MTRIKLYNHIISTDYLGIRTKIKNFVKMELDLRLLKWILDGPKFAVWNNAEIGSHIQFSRNPDKYERGLYYSLSYFHC